MSDVFFKLPSLVSPTHDPGVKPALGTRDLNPTPPVVVRAPTSSKRWPSSEKAARGCQWGGIIMIDHRARKPILRVRRQQARAYRPEACGALHSPASLTNLASYHACVCVAGSAISRHPVVKRTTAQALKVDPALTCIRVESRGTKANLNRPAADARPIPGYAPLRVLEPECGRT